MCSVALTRVRGTILPVEKHLLQCVSVALVFQHAISMRHIVICGLSGSIIFFHILTNSAIFEEKHY